MILGLLGGLAAFTIFFVVSLLIVRFCAADLKPRYTQRVLVSCAAALVVGLWPGVNALQGSAIAHGGWIMGSVWGLLTYFGFFALYMPFYYTVVASLSVQSIILMRQQPNGTAITNLREVFASRRLIEQRLATMAINGFVARNNGCYTLTAKGRILARTFSLIKKEWRLGDGG
jgi:hypothetical protein